MSTQNSEPEYFTPLHHKVAEMLGYRQTPGYATWDKVEATAPVQEVDRVVYLINQEALALLDRLEKRADGDLCTVRYSDGSVARMRVVDLKAIEAEKSKYAGE